MIALIFRIYLRKFTPIESYSPKAATILMKTT